MAVFLTHHFSRRTTRAAEFDVRPTVMKTFMPKLRRTTIIGCSILCGLISARSFFFAATHAQGIIRNLVFGGFFLGLAFAIFRQYRWALRLAATICILVAIVLPIGLFNPFTAGDYIAAGSEAPSVIQTLLWLIPLEASLLAIVFIIDPRKKKADHETS